MHLLYVFILPQRQRDFIHRFLYLAKYQPWTPLVRSLQGTDFVLLAIWVFFFAFPMRISFFLFHGQKEIYVENFNKKKNIKMNLLMGLLSESHSSLHPISLYFFSFSLIFSNHGYGRVINV